MELDLNLLILKCGDATEKLQEVESGSVDLVITSPNLLLLPLSRS